MNKSLLFFYTLINVFILNSCANTSTKERIDFAQLLLKNIDSSSNIIQNSNYYCGDKRVFNKGLQDSIKQYIYEFEEDKIQIDKAYAFNYETKTMMVDKIDTIHVIVFKNIKNKSFLSIVYYLKNNKWCLENAVLGNMLKKEKYPDYD